MHEPRSSIGYRPISRRPRIAVALALMLVLTALASMDAVLSGGHTASKPMPDALPLQPITVPTQPDALQPRDTPNRADYEAGTKPDLIGRIVVDVTVNRQGPFHFALDTGANRTVLTPSLVAILGLATNDGDGVQMNGVTGSAAVPTALVDRLAAGGLL